MKQWNNKRILFISLAAILLLSTSLGIIFELYELFIIPLLVLGTFLVILDYKIIYYLLIFSIPLSIEINLPGGFSIDLISEPLMIVLTAVYFIDIIAARKFDTKFLLHPFIFLVILQLIWLLIPVLFSTSWFVSVKYLLSKIWYITAFVLLTGQIIQSREDIKKIFWWFYAGLLIAIVQTSVRHAFEGFSFDTINNFTVPFFKNHVNYSITIALFLPFVWYFRGLYKKKSFQYTLLSFSRYFFIFAIIFSYTRASWIALIFAFCSYFMIHHLLTQKVLLLSGIVIIVAIAYLLNENKYLDYSPKYEKTVSHRKFEKKLEATYTMEDISGMERIYRWVASYHMFLDRPVTGTGPNTFYPEYKKYTVSSFATYVSDNPEKSTTHNNYLLILTEQGMVGLLLFVMWIIIVLTRGTKIYHASLQSSPLLTPPKRGRTGHPLTTPRGKGAGKVPPSGGFRGAWDLGGASAAIAMAALLSFIIIIIHLFLADFMKVDKVASIFFISAVILAKLDLWLDAERREFIEIDSHLSAF
ncbi:MAG: O-antigen ligase family protein [Cytophagales bacterium]|nr:O-antigen ligase family protein [Cytophagales bacterium]